MPTTDRPVAAPSAGPRRLACRSSLVVVRRGGAASACCPARRRPVPGPRGLHGRGRRRRRSDLTTEQAENAGLIAAIARTPWAAGPGGVDRAGDGVPGEQARATSTTATATRSGCSSSGRRRAGAPREQIIDPVYATNAFYDALVEIDGYQDMRITEAAQAVQRSGFPEAYEEHAEGARALASALTGYSPARLQLRRRRRRDVAAEEPGDSRADPARRARSRADLERRLRRPAAGRLRARRA